MAFFKFADSLLIDIEPNDSAFFAEFNRKR